MNNLLKYGIGLAALGLTVYVAGVAWRRSQKNNKNGDAGFAGATGTPRKLSKSRFAAIKKSGGFGRADGFADAGGSRLSQIQKSGGFRR